MSDYGLDETRGPAQFTKTPDEAIVIEFPWAARLDGETISSVSYELPDGLTNAAQAGATSLRTIRVTGGTDGQLYRVIGKVVTSGSRTLEWVKRVQVAEG